MATSSVSDAPFKLFHCLGLKRENGGFLLHGFQEVKRKTTALHLEEPASWGSASPGTQGAEHEESSSLERKLGPLDPNSGPRGWDGALLKSGGFGWCFRGDLRPAADKQHLLDGITFYCLKALCGSRKEGSVRRMKLWVPAGVLRYVSRQNLHSFTLCKLLGFLDMGRGKGPMSK